MSNKPYLLRARRHSQIKTERYYEHKLYMLRARRRSQITDIHKTLGILLYLTFIFATFPAMTEFKLVWLCSSGQRRRL